MYTDGDGVAEGVQLNVGMFLEELLPQVDVELCLSLVGNVDDVGRSFSLLGRLVSGFH